MRVSLVDADTADHFRYMTFPRYRPLLGFDPALPRVVGIGAWDENRPVALALGGIHPDDPLAELLSLYVEPSHRGRGVATRVLSEAEAEFAQGGAQEVVA